MNIIENARVINKFAKMCNNFCHSLEEIKKKEHPDQNTLLLVRDVLTICNSTYAILERFMKLKVFLILLLIQNEWKQKAGLAKAKFRREDWPSWRRSSRCLRSLTRSPSS